MGNDLLNPFEAIFPNPQGLRQQIHEILPHIQARRFNNTPNFTFLGVENTDRITNDHDDDDEDQAIRPFAPHDAEDPNLKLVLLKTDDRMGLTMKAYLAVSYCWPSDADDLSHLGNLNASITIKEADGSTRPARARPHIIRRAIRHATDLGLKYIWIDQESINQEDSEEKQAAIQSMDRVYQNAAAILCLLHLNIDDQEKIDLLESLHMHNRGDVRSQFNSMTRHLMGLRLPPSVANLLADTMELVASDRWFTRAWVMHERLCSSSLSSKGIWASVAPGLSSVVPGEVCLLGTDQLEDAEEAAFRLENNDKDAQSAPADSNEIDGHNQKRKSLWEEYGKDECLEAAKRLQEAISNFSNAYKLVRPAAQRRRLADSVRSFYSPLQITQLLAPLGCLYQSDKIAMLANICQWTSRIDTRLVEERGWSFSLCIWMLAIANGNASFFCNEDECQTHGSVRVDAWAPSQEVIIGKMYCGGLLDHVSMNLGANGLRTEGWLWRATRFIDLSDLRPIIHDISNKDLTIENSAWNKYEFKTFTVEDKGTKLKEFFWALLLKLFASKEFAIANLIWAAAKLRYHGGFYGRSLQHIPIENFDKIVDSDTGEYAGCYDNLGITKEQEEDNLFFSYGPIAPEVIEYLRRSCAHCRATKKWTEDDQEQDSAIEEPSHVLLGNEEQLSGIAWVRDSILEHGGLSVGELVSGKELKPAPDEYHGSDCNESDSADRQAVTNLALLNIAPTLDGESHVFTLHREVRKYKQGDGKAMHLVHPFDVWLNDAPVHTDAPFCWNASLDAKELHIGKPANSLFDIGEVKRTEYWLSWPKVYELKSWT